MKTTQKQVEYSPLQYLVDFFFAGCNVFNVSDVVASLAAGKVLEAERLPVELLPSVVLLTTVGLRTFNQQIVDDYEMLLNRMSELYRHSDSAALGVWHPQLHLVSMLCDGGPAGPDILSDNPEAQYIQQVYAYLVSRDVNELFAEVAA